MVVSELEAVYLVRYEVLHFHLTVLLDRLFLLLKLLHVDVVQREPLVLGYDPEIPRGLALYELVLGVVLLLLLHHEVVPVVVVPQQELDLLPLLLLLLVVWHLPLLFLLFARVSLWRWLLAPLRLLFH